MFSNSAILEFGTLIVKKHTSMTVLPVNLDYCRNGLKKYYLPTLVIWGGTQPMVAVSTFCLELGQRTALPGSGLPGYQTYLK